MRIKSIEYHLGRAAHFRRLAALPEKLGPGYPGPEAAARKAAQHEEQAAAYLAAGLREYGARAQTAGAREQRKRRRRRRVDPRTDPAMAGKGRGRRSGDGWVWLGRGKGFARKDPP